MLKLISVELLVSGFLSKAILILSISSKNQNVFSSSNAKNDTDKEWRINKQIQHLLHSLEIPSPIDRFQSSGSFINYFLPCLRANESLIWIMIPTNWKRKKDLLRCYQHH